MRVEFVRGMKTIDADHYWLVISTDSLGTANTPRSGQYLLPFSLFEFEFPRHSRAHLSENVSTNDSSTITVTCPTIAGRIMNSTRIVLQKGKLRY